MNIAPDVDALCTVLKAACRIDDAIGGSIHLVSEDGYELVAHNDLTPEFRAAIDRPVDGDGTTYSQARTERRRVAVRDIRTDPAFEPYRSLAEDAGIVGVQSMPILHGRFLYGVLTTYFAQPHHPGPESQAPLDACARIAALVLVANEREDTIEPEQERSGRIAAQRQDPDAAATRVGATVQAMLSACETESPAELLHATEKKLIELVGELSKRTHVSDAAPGKQRPVDEVQCPL
ncbi:MAG: GAF domain-containing protein [Xanthomonadaceae bacterium]|nr:GAF domain-containing protein [Xanthomonadaceae bacterium]